MQFSYIAVDPIPDGNTHDIPDALFVIDGLYSPPPGDPMGEYPGLMVTIEKAKGLPKLKSAEIDPLTKFVVTDPDILPRK